MKEMTQKLLDDFNDDFLMLYRKFQQIKSHIKENYDDVAVDIEKSETRWVGKASDFNAIFPKLPENIKNLQKAVVEEENAVKEMNIEHYKNTVTEENINQKINNVTVQINTALDTAYQIENIQNILTSIKELKEKATIVNISRFKGNYKFKNNRDHLAIILTKMVVQNILKTSANAKQTIYIIK
jgi:uncharacterized protein YukE